MVTNVVTTPVEQQDVVSFVKVKKHLRVDFDFKEEDEIIDSYIDAAIAVAEDFIGGHIVEKTIKIEMNQFDSPLVFEAFPVKEITSVKYYEASVEEEKTLLAAEYKLTSETFKRFVLRFKNELPTTETRDDAVSVTIKVGMEAVPKPIVQAVLLMVADMYERREDRVETISTTSAALLRPYKKY
jgi:uncharacterized phiE125 gp8 family phage protein